MKGFSNCKAVLALQNTGSMNARRRQKARFVRDVKNSQTFAGRDHSYCPFRCFFPSRKILAVAPGIQSFVARLEVMKATLSGHVFTL